MARVETDADAGCSAGLAGDDVSSSGDEQSPLTANYARERSEASRRSVASRSPATTSEIIECAYDRDHHHRL
jgi:hypothetical protein